MKKILILISFCTLFISCSSKDFFVNQDYAEMKIKDASLIIPTISEFKISHTENVFTEEELFSINKLFVDEVNKKLIKQIKALSSFSKVDFANLEERIAKESVRLPYAKGEAIHFELPKKPLPFVDKAEKYILFFESLSLSIYRKERETSDPAKHFSATAPTPQEIKLSPAKLSDQVFACEVKYVFYDNQNGKAVAYGIKHLEEKINESPSMDNLISEIINKLASALIKNTPFQK